MASIIQVSPMIRKGD